MARRIRSRGVGRSVAHGHLRRAISERLGLYFRRHLPAARQGRGIGFTGLQHRGDGLASRRDRRCSRAQPHAILVLDQAGWHVSKTLPVPPNITLVSQPPKSPELNPDENIWQFMRDNWLSNRVFTSYTNIVDHCCYAWNKLVDQPWLIMSIGTRQWANRSCS